MYPRIAFRSFSTLTTLTLAAALLSPVALAQTPEPAVSDPAAPEAPGAATAAPAAEATPGLPSAAPEPAAVETAAPAPEATPAAGEAAPSEPAPSAAEAVPVPSPPVAPWYDAFSIGGGVILYYYQPTFDDAKNNISVFFANLILDAKWEEFGLHIEPRFRTVAG